MRFKDAKDMEVNFAKTHQRMVIAEKIMGMLIVKHYDGKCFLSIEEQRQLNTGGMGYQAEINAEGCTVTIMKNDDSHSS